MLNASRAGLLPVMMLIMGIAPLVTYAASSLSPVLTVQLGIAPARFGMFATVSFLSATLFSRLFAGLSDRLSDRSQLTIIFGCAAMSFTLFAAAQDLMWLLIAAAISGPAHALSNPFTNRMVAHRVAAELRTRWMGVKQSGVQCSQAFAGLALPLAASTFGWRASLIALSFVSLVLLRWARTYAVRGDAAESPVRTPVPDGTTIGQDAPIEIPFSRRAVYLFAAYALFSGAGLQGTNVYLPLFAQNDLGLGAIAAGITVAVAGATGLCARIFWGRVMAGGADASALLVWMAAAAAGGILCLMGAAVFGVEPLMWIGTLIHGATAIGSNVIIMVGVLRHVPVSRTGAASATVGIGMYLGFALGPLLMGSVLGSTHSYLAAWCAVTLCYAAAFATALRLLWSARSDRR